MNRILRGSNTSSSILSKVPDITLAFWLAYILTRPMGASFADWFDKPADIGGLGYGDIRVGLFLTAAILAVVVWMSTARSQGSLSRRAAAQRSAALGEASEG